MSEIVYKPNIHKTLTIAVIFAILFAYVCIPLIPFFNQYPVLSVATFSAGLSGIVWTLFDNYLWKWSISRCLNLSCQPDLNGDWIGNLDREGENKPHEFKMSVKQRFSTISIRTESKNSNGSSITTAFLTDEFKSNFILIDYWRCTTKSIKNPNEQQQFNGLSRVIIKKKENGDITLDIVYFTNRNPSTKGKVILTREKK